MLKLATENCLILQKTEKNERARQLKYIDEPTQLTFQGKTWKNSAFPPKIIFTHQDFCKRNGIGE